MKENSTSSRPFSEDEMRELAALEKMPDEAIDTSDIAEISAEQWRMAERGNLYRPLKQSITIRLDADVLAWFKEHTTGSGYQTEINDVLRRHVTSQLKRTA
jgi:uncharacterized protein (DUF4415 family)